MDSSRPISPDSPPDPSSDPTRLAADCLWRSRLGAFHDGELDSATATALESHLAACPDCRAELEDIAELSSLAAAIGSGGLSKMALRNIHRAIDAEDRFTIFRIAGLLTGLAASALVVGGAWLWEAPPAGSMERPLIVVGDNKAPQWENVAVNLGVDPLPTSDWEARDQAMFADARVAAEMAQDFMGNR